MEQSKIIIAIDGHSSTGKSSFAKQVAARLGYVYVDTGAMYRAVTYFAYTNGFIDNKNKIDEEGLQQTLGANRVSFRPGPDGKSQTWLNNACVEKQIRTLNISNKVSKISALPFVREYIDKILRSLGQEKGVVMDGRDIGTSVFPNAELKIFMTAAVEVRAQRRFKEIQEAGGKESYDDVLKNLKERDHIDQTREVSPLRKADDAILLDNSNMSIPEQFVWLDRILLERFGLQMR
ncbi:MAG: (d)CMP kinase [Bacteroidales bacterium]|nr:(d)CMP kinase [Bacteroidales bacterium]